MALYTDSSGATITTMIPSYYDRVWLERLEANLVYDKYGVKKNLPKGEGSSVIWHQLLNPGLGYTISETDAVGSSAMSTRKVSAVLAWKGDCRNVTTRVEATAVNPIVKEMVAALGYGAGLTKDAYISEAIGFGSCTSLGATYAASTRLPSVYTQGFPLYDGNTDTCYWAVTALQNGKFSSTPTVAQVRGAVAKLRTLDAMPFEDGTYRGIIHPAMSKAIRAATDFSTWMAYTNRSAMERGKLGTIEDVTFEESSQAFTAAMLLSAWSAQASGGTVYGTLICGKGAYGVTNLRGEEAKVNILTGADKSDPHNLHTYITYKFAVAAKVLNPSAGIILTTLVSD